MRNISFVAVASRLPVSAMKKKIEMQFRTQLRANIPLYIVLSLALKNEGKKIDAN